MRLRAAPVVGVVVSLYAHGHLQAQVRGVPAPTPPRRDTVRPRPDSTRRDTTAAADSSRPKELIKWNEQDSVMRELIARHGYTATRYQSSRAVFNAQTRALTLEGDSVAKSGVNREQTVLVADSIVYNDSTKIIVARGDTVILRDPEQQAADVIAHHRMAYNVELHRGAVQELSTQIAETGQNWFVGGATAAFVSDTTRGRQTAFYVRNGTITSCDDSIPDYHFQAKEIKMVSKNIMVARPAVLYIGDVPVMWLPFIFQDMRSGRRSGVLTPRLGLSEIFRQSPSYRRHIDNLGYYFAINDYLDAQFALDWRSGSRPTSGDPGYTRLNGEMQYRWLDRFMTGRFGISELNQRDGSGTTNITWTHQQNFSQSTSLAANINYVSNTFVQRTTTFNPAQVLATIGSSANYSTKLGPASLSLGGSRQQYTGRAEVQQTFPNFSITSPTVSPTSWLDWTPGFNFTTTQTLNADQAGEFGYRFFTDPTGQPDSVKLKHNVRQTNSGFSTPIRIGGFTWGNSFSFSDQESNAPVTIPVVDVADSSNIQSRVFAKTFSSALDWQTSITLPNFLQNSIKMTPSLSFNNVDGHAFWLRSEQNGGKWVHQSKRPSVQLSGSPTLFGLFPGFGPFTRLRHSITPTITYSYAPTGSISDEYLRALNKSRQGYLGALAQNRLGVGITTVLEAKQRSTDTSANAEQKKVKLLSLTFSPLTYDFERARKTHRSGFVTDNIHTDIVTDLIPGFRGGIDYSLYQGNVDTDSARFKPFRTRIDAAVTLNGQSGIFGAITRIFSRAVPTNNPQIERVQGSPDDALASAVGSMPVAGVSARNRQYSLPPTQGWSLNLQYSEYRQRPPTGNGTVIEFNPATLCAPALSNPIVYAQCIADQRGIVNGGLPPGTTTSGTPFIKIPPQQNLNSVLNFHLTPKWSGTWSTNYDFQAHKFGSQIVSLQRELHDWRAIFGFTQAPNGNFAFNFFIALNAEPDLKFNYDRQTYRPVVR